MEGTSKMGSKMNQLEGDNSSDDSKSGSENYEVGDDLELAPVAPAVASGSKSSSSSKRKKYNRHTPNQIHELESYFKVCPHPDDRQRTNLGSRLGLNGKQVKFWFQNKRTQLKTQLERHENALLKQEFEKLRTENITLKQYMHKPTCQDCGGESTPISMKEHQIRLENARLKQELIRVCGLAEALLGKPVSDMVSSTFPPPQAVPESTTAGLASNGEANLGSEITIMPPPPPPSGGFGGGLVVFGDYEKSLYLQVAMAAMDELIVLARNEPPFWHRNLNGWTEMFNHEEYVRKFNPYGADLPGFTHEATRETGSVIINSSELVNILMHPGRWADMFCCMVRKAIPISILSNGVHGTHDGEMILIEAELLFPSPFVPIRYVRFIRFCKNYGEGAWAIVDISIDPLREGYEDITRRCRMLPSGFCIMQDGTNAYSVVTCIQHAEYDENVINSLFRPLVRSGCAFGAHRWIATMQRQCEYAAYLPTSGITPLESSIGITLQGRQCILRLTRRIIDKFCDGICISPTTKWDVLKLGDLAPNMQVMTRVSIDEPGEPCGVILSFSTSLWMPRSRQQVFEFLRNGQLRGHWDILADEGPMEETVRIVKSTNSANSVTILCPPDTLGNGISGLSIQANQNKELSMAVLQETWADMTSSAVVYSAVNIDAITQVMEGGDPEIIKLLPSGFVISDAIMEPVDGQLFSGQAPSSLLTLGFQILMNTSPVSSLSMDSVQTVKELMARTIIKIKAALGCE